MTGPRDPVPQLGVPVDPWTGYPLAPVILARIQRYREADKAFRLVLHELDGSSEGTRPGNACMIEAFYKLDEVRQWVLTSLLEHTRS